MTRGWWNCWFHIIFTLSLPIRVIISDSRGCLINDNEICKELRSTMRLLIHIFGDILCIFSLPNINLKDRMRKLSTLSHILYHQYRQGSKFIPGQLCQDLQQMVQVSYCVCALLKVRGGGKIFIRSEGESIQQSTHHHSCTKLWHFRTMPETASWRGYQSNL